MTETIQRKGLLSQSSGIHSSIGWGACRLGQYQASFAFAFSCKKTCLLWDSISRLLAHSPPSYLQTKEPLLLT